MNLQEQISRIQSMMNIIKENIHDRVKDIILNATEWDDWVKAVKLQYGDYVSLYHATTEKNAEIIDKEGFKLTHGKNYKSFAKEPMIYFQLGTSDYVSSNRPVLYKIDVPIEIGRAHV